MHLLKESIEKYGILAPLIVRPVSDMKFEVCEMNVTEADVKERVFFLNIMVRNTFPFSRLPFTVSISTIDTSGFASTNELKSSIVRPWRYWYSSLVRTLLGRRALYTTFLGKINISDFKYIFVNVVIQSSFGYTKLVSVRCTDVI